MNLSTTFGAAIIALAIAARFSTIATKSLRLRVGSQDKVTSELSVLLLCSVIARTPNFLPFDQGYQSHLSTYEEKAALLRFALCLSLSNQVDLNLL
jgi:hypothetical protein